MRKEVLRYNLHLLHELEIAASNLSHGIDDVYESTTVMADMFYTQTKNFVDELTNIVIAQYNRTNKG